MKVFEDLIEELKEENLIEESESDFNRQSLQTAATAAAADREPVAVKGASATRTLEEQLSDSGAGDVILPFNENDFYRRRAMEEVSSLQMVERVFSGVEREQAKIAPKPYDDLAVSKALHDFLQVSKNSQGGESAAAEFKLMQETESWYSALSHRDQNILPVHLRRYCETTRPVLSSQALVALARFYRNSPYSESVRSKFDLIVTRLFSREIENERREAVFEFDELAHHLSELYADWSSVPLYSTEDDSELSVIALKFENFIGEAEKAAEFEELVRSDFFNRLRAFKESTGENFYAPPVTATAVHCNIRVGNRYVELLEAEKRNNNAARLEDKYSFLLDQTISEATSKTLQLVQILKEKKHYAEEAVAAAAQAARHPKVKIAVASSASGDDKTETKTQSSYKNNPFQVSKWLMALTIFTVISTLALYFWVEFFTPQASSKEVQTFQMDSYYFKDYLKVAKITNETLIGIANPSWGELNEEKKQEVLKNLISVGKDKGFKSVHLLNNDGKTVGYISVTNITQGNSNQN